MNTVVTSPVHGDCMPDQVDAVRLALRTSLYPGASDASIDMVLGYCKAAGLDPMLKPVHIVPMWDSKMKATRDVVMPGIGLYRTIAARTGEFAGLSEPEFGPIVTESIGGRDVSFPEWCKVTAYRRLSSGHVAAFTALEYWIENYGTKGGDPSPNAMWSKRARGQLAKCTQAQAIRMAFPEAVGSVPIAEEMEGKSFIENETPAHTPSVSNPLGFYPIDDFKKNLPKWNTLVLSGKPADQIIAMVQTKGRLTDEQINAIKYPPQLDTVTHVSDQDVPPLKE